MPAMLNVLDGLPDSREGRSRLEDPVGGARDRRLVAPKNRGERIPGRDRGAALSAMCEKICKPDRSSLLGRNDRFGGVHIVEAVVGPYNNDMLLPGGVAGQGQCEIVAFRSRV